LSPCSRQSKAKQSKAKRPSILRAPAWQSRLFGTRAVSIRADRLTDGLRRIAEADRGAPNGNRDVLCHARARRDVRGATVGHTGLPSCPPQTAPTSPPWRCTAPKRAVPSLRFRSVCSENCLSFAAIAPACDCAAAQPLPRRTAVPLGACAECEQGAGGTSRAGCAEYPQYPSTLGTPEYPEYPSSLPALTVD
jgi:hypothetical protein